MGDKGAKHTSAAESAANELLARLTTPGPVSSRKMFGGWGIFADGTMFGIVDSGGKVFLRAGEANTKLFEDAGSERHGKMPYFSVPDGVLANTSTLNEWASVAADVAREAKKK